MNDRKGYVILAIGFIAVALYFLTRPDSKAALIKFVTQKPGQLAGLPEQEKVKPKNTDLIAGLLTDLVTSRRRVEVVDKNTVLGNLKNYEADHDLSKAIPVCDLLSFSRKDYTGANRDEIKNDLFEVLQIRSEYAMNTRCSATLDCDPFYNEIVRSNNADDLKWIEPLSRARSTEEVLSLNIDGDEILYFKALVYGGHLWAENINSKIDLKKAISILQSLEKKYPDNGVYPYSMISLKSQAQLNFNDDLERFLNATIWSGPAEKMEDFLYRQASLAPANYFSYLGQSEAMPKASYVPTHNIFKTLIPQLSERQKITFRKIARFMYDQNVQNKGRLAGFGFRSYAENWLRRLHDEAKVAQFVDYFEIQKGTIREHKMWDRFYDKIYDGQCDETGLTEAFKVERDWAEQTSN